MELVPASNLACPIDGSPLIERGGPLCCGAGHAFDRAREGYWNLLVVQHKASLEPGDSKPMVAARQRFLAAQHFAPLAAHVSDVVTGLIARLPYRDRAFNVVDAGCGEGYYLEEVARVAVACREAHRVTLTGIDVSKWAVRAAAKRGAPATWLVANNARPPFIPGSVAVVMCLFGFPVWEGFAKMQATGGRVVMADPGPDHLIELREIIYPEVVRSPATSLRAGEASGYRLECEDRLRFSVQLTSGAMIGDLLAMTPHAHRLSQAGREALGQRTSLSLTVDVAVRTLVLG